MSDRVTCVRDLISGVEYGHQQHLFQNLWVIPLVAASGGRVFILEHSWFSHNTPDFQFIEYDPVSDTHTLKTSLPTHVQNTQKASLVGVAESIYLFGGEEKLTFQYEPGTEQWHELIPSPHMVTTGYYPIVRSSDILLCGGFSEGKDKIWNRILSYNVYTKQWKILDFCLPFRYIHDVADFYLMPHTTTA